MGFADFYGDPDGECDGADRDEAGDAVFVLTVDWDSDEGSACGRKQMYYTLRINGPDLITSHYPWINPCVFARSAPI